jgi:UDP-N-acetylglucosamine 1-carboxyvinyltransferase
VGANIYLDVVSVGATINIMLAAVKAEGLTTIENAAKEPYVVDIANFLNAMGADIKGAGTDIIRIRGGKELKGNVVHSIIPDQIEAGTYMIAAAATRGDVVVKNVIPKHMESLSAKLIEMNVKVEEYDDSIRVYSKDKLAKVNIKTLPYPVFRPIFNHRQLSCCCGLKASALLLRVFSIIASNISRSSREWAQKSVWKAEWLS